MDLDDADLASATARGMRPDASLGRDHGDLWREAWEPNERAFDATFEPRGAADIVLPTA